jgi:hypothetical protein
VLPGVAVAAWFAGEMTPLAEESQGNHLAAGQGSPGPGAFSGGSWYLQKSSVIT